MKILLLEDDTMLNHAIDKFLKIKGHKVETFKDGASAKESIESTSYDLLLLDINVPKIDGLSLLGLLQAQKIQTPTIFISAIIDIGDISRAFDLGCYDYLKKPFHLKELELRIDKLLQSCYLPKRHIRISPHYSLDLENATLLFQGHIETLSVKHLKILTLLAQNRDRVVDYMLFQEYAWEGTEVEVPTIRAEINRLKKILKEEMIVNIRNMGYMIKKPD